MDLSEDSNQSANNDHQKSKKSYRRNSSPVENQRREKQADFNRRDRDVNRRDRDRDRDRNSFRDDKERDRNHREDRIRNHKEDRERSRDYKNDRDRVRDRNRDRNRDSSNRRDNRDNRDNNRSRRRDDNKERDRDRGNNDYRERDRDRDHRDRDRGDNRGGDRDNISSNYRGNRSGGERSFNRDGSNSRERRKRSESPRERRNDRKRRESKSRSRSRDREATNNTNKLSSTQPSNDYSNLATSSREYERMNSRDNKESSYAAGQTSSPSPLTSSSSPAPTTPSFSKDSNSPALEGKKLDTVSTALPSYYNPTVVNPNKYAQQAQKRKLLWSNKKAEETVGKWGNAKFAQDTDGKVASKFMRLMGIKGAPKAEEGPSTPDGNQPTESIKKREEMFSSMEQQYEVARQVTHTMRGVGLGFGSQPRQF